MTALLSLENVLGRTPIYAATRQVVADTTVVDSDGLLLVFTSGTPVTLTLPSAAANDGRTWAVKKIGGADDVIVAAADLIDGGALLILSDVNAAAVVQSDGATYWRGARGGPGRGGRPRAPA